VARVVAAPASTPAALIADARTGPDVAVVAPVVTLRRIPHRVAARPLVFVPGPTSWSDLNAAIARIPTYRPGIARWAIGGAGGSWWGTADWYRGVIYVNASTPTALLYDVAVHEWSHLLTVRDYGGDVDLTVSALRRAFGGTGILGAERAADCMAIVQGARWTHYTRCTVPAWRAMARRLLRGDRA